MRHGGEGARLEEEGDLVLEVGDALEDAVGNERAGGERQAAEGEGEQVARAAAGRGGSGE